MSVLLCRPLFSHNHSFSPRYYIGEPYLSKLMESVSSVDGHHLHHSTPIAGMYDLSKHCNISLFYFYIPSTWSTDVRLLGDVGYLFTHCCDVGTKFHSDAFR